MTAYSDDINKGYEVVLRHLNDIELVNRIYNLTAIDPLAEHHTFANHYGGISFNLDIRSIHSKWEIVYTYKDLFDIIGHTEQTEEIFLDFSYSDLENILYALVQGIKAEEEALLKNAIDPNYYRKVAKRMHYNKKYGDPFI